MRPVSWSAVFRSASPFVSVNNTASLPGNSCGQHNVPSFPLTVASTSRVPPLEGIRTMVLSLEPATIPSGPQLRPAGNASGDNVDGVPPVNETFLRAPPVFPESPTQYATDWPSGENIGPEINPSEISVPAIGLASKSEMDRRYKR